MATQPSARSAAQVKRCAPIQPMEPSPDAFLCPAPVRTPAGMIAVVYGTTGELIKLSPVLTQLRERRAAVMTLCTGQQVEQIPAMLEDFRLPQPDLWLSHGCHGHDLKRPADLPSWCAGIVSTFARHRRALHARLTAAQAKPLLIIHGDTLTTVLGALMGRLLHIPVAHVESGMRTGDWRNPFPEELDRLIAAKLARTHFAPGARAVANLRAMHVRGEIVDTGANTISDAIKLVCPTALNIELPQEPFGLASLHRTELLRRPTRLRAILSCLRNASRSTPILFVDHPVTAAAIAANDLDSMFDRRFRRIPRQRYFNFIALLKASTFLVTDSGGSQQECAQLGHPCLVHRAASEHQDGLNGSVVLSRMDLNIVSAFLKAPNAFARAPSADQQTPTEIIIDYLKRRGYLTTAPTPPPRQPRHRANPNPATAPPPTPP
jgi:UDP-N-acetylglucosamine 2-epimerase (non-hydrolysing)